MHNKKNIYFPLAVLCITMSSMHAIPTLSKFLLLGAATGAGYVAYHEGKHSQAVDRLNQEEQADPQAKYGHMFVEPYYSPQTQELFRHNQQQSAIAYLKKEAEAAKEKALFSRCFKQDN